MCDVGKETLLKHVSEHGQDHLVQFWDQLNEAEKKHLSDEILAIDFGEINRFYQKVVANKQDKASKVDALMQPVPKELKGSYQQSSADQLKVYEKNGLQAVSQGEVAVLLLAGGQGTRLGVNYPKGMYSVTLPSKKTLYQLQAERILKIQNLAEKEFSSKGIVTWYIMTSEHTQDSTINFFKSHDYFGLDPANVKFFEQNNLPCLTNEGKVILDEKHKLSKAPDGNGGLYRALAKQKIIDHMFERGVKYVHVYCVDNILVKMADPVFIGFCIEKNANCAAKVVKKAFPEEAVGVICKVADRFQVVEYSEISADTAKELDSDGELKYNAGNICNHYFNTEFLNILCKNHEHELKHHVAEKKIPYINESGERIAPHTPNGIKLEKFVFDVFPFSTASWAKGNFAIWEVNREDEFSPLKNDDKAKKDTPTTCRNDLMNMHYRWLLTAGAKFNLKESEVPMVEISPLVSYNGEGLEELVKDKVIDSPFFVEDKQA